MYLPSAHVVTLIAKLELFPSIKWPWVATWNLEMGGAALLHVGNYIVVCMHIVGPAPVVPMGDGYEQWCPTVQP